MDTCVQPTTQHTHSIIFLHGRDSVASDFADEIFESQGSDGRTFPQLLTGARWIFPTAPLLEAERYSGMVLSQWFDMWTTENPHEREDEQEIEVQVARIQDIIANEVASIGAANVFLAGISQGCTIGLHAMLSQKCRLGGFVGLSSWILNRTGLHGTAQGPALDTPVFLAHHIEDDIINVRYGEEMRDVLVTMGMDVSWHSYTDSAQEMKHWLNEPHGVDDAVHFIHQRVQPSEVWLDARAPTCRVL